MSSISQHAKKCKHNAGTPQPALVLLPRTVKGPDFWSMVEKWFSACMEPDQLGISWNKPGWTKYVVPLCFDCFSISDMFGKYSYINKTIQKDHTKYKPTPIINPFLSDFTDEMMGSAGGRNNEAVLVLGAIGSMQGILGIL